MKEDQDKVNRKLTELNRNKPEKPWIAITGINVLPELKKTVDGKYVMSTDTGYSVKLFANKKTGELKAYAYSIFGVDQ